MMQSVVGGDSALARAMQGALESMEQMLPGRSVYLTNSGTAALTAALRVSARTDKRNVVALPAYCCPDIGTAAIGAGYSILLYDTVPRTLMPDWDSVRACFMKGASHVVVAHLLGRIVDLSDATMLAAEHGGVVIEDAAQGAGGRLNGVPAGSLAPFSALSFGRGKGLNAGGGGAFTLATGGADTLGVRERALEISSDFVKPGFKGEVAIWIKTVLSQLLSVPWLYAIPASVPALKLGETLYHEPVPAGSPGVVLASLIQNALQTSEIHRAARQLVESWYYAMLGDHQEMVMAPPAPNVVSGALRFPVMLRPDKAAALTRHGVARYYPRTLAEYPQISAALEAKGADLPGARELASALHTLPTHSLANESDRKKLVSAILSK